MRCHITSLMYHDSLNPRNEHAAIDNKDWWRGAVIYQIYPRSFQDSNGDGMGDIAGITQRIPYIKNLGVDAIWICPFYQSPMHDGGYDVSNHCEVHPLFGTMQAFDELIAQAHHHKIKVMIDLVLSHTSSEHAWFTQSTNESTGDFGDWYVWANGSSVVAEDGSIILSPPNNWLSLFGGSAWQWNAVRQQYYLHNFWASQPDLNFHNAHVQDAVLGIVQFWLDRGVDGFRIDTANYFFHDRLLRDNPQAQVIHARADGLPAGTDYAAQQHVHDKSQPENIEFLARMRGLVDRYPNRVLLAEIGDDQALERMAEYTAGEDRFHMAYSFHLLEENFSTQNIQQLLTDLDQGLSKGWPCWSLSNHDVPRVLTRWFPDADKAEQEKLAVLLMAMLLSLRGSICLYQGDELGLDEAQVPFESLQDSFGITHWPKFKGRDGCRTPMPWSSEEAQCGFSQAEKIWLPLSPTHVSRSASDQSQQLDSVLCTTQRLIDFRHRQAALRLGSFNISTIDEDCLCIRRSLNGQDLVVVLNFSHQTLSMDGAALRHTSLVEGLFEFTGYWFDDAFHLPPFSASYLHQPSAASIKLACIIKTGDK